MRKWLQHLVHKPNVKASFDASAWLQDIAQNAKSKDIVDFFWLVFDDDLNVAGGAAALIERVAATITSLQWHTLDSTSRSYLRTGSLSLKPHDLDRLDRFSSTRTILLGLASFHYDGFVRQEAVRKLASGSDGTELPFLLIRANDWVPQVSQTALTACRERMVVGYVKHVLNALPLLALLTEPRRRDISGLYQDARDLLLRPECLPELTQASAADDRLIRRASANLGLAAPGKPSLEMFEACFRSQDSLIRRWAVRRLRDLPPNDSTLERSAAPLADDPVPAIRRDYLYLCHDKMLESARGALRDALLDANASVREIARYYLPKYEDIDLRAFYLSALAEQQSSLVAAVAGVGETGNAGDAAVVQGYLHHPVTSVREAAVTALGRLDGEHHVELLLQSVNDPRSRVSKVATRALMKHVWLVDDAMLLQTMLQAQAPFARSNALRLVFHLPRWRSGLLLLQAYMQSPSPESQGEVLSRLSQWLSNNNRSFARPSEEQRQQWQRLLDQHANMFPASLAVQLREAM